MATRKLIEYTVYRGNDPEYDCDHAPYTVIKKMITNPTPDIAWIERVVRWWNDIDEELIKQESELLYEREDEKGKH